MSKTRVAPKRRAPKVPPALPLAAIAVQEIENVAGESRRRTPEPVSLETLALGLDFIERFHWRSKPGDWPPQHDKVAGALHGLADVLRTRWLEELSTDAQDFLVLSVSYLAVLVEVAAGSTEARARRYVVRVPGAVA